MIRSPLLIGEAFRHDLFPDANSGYYRPTQTISYLLDYCFWGREAFGFHLSNICWHVAGSLLLFFLLRRLFALLLPGEEMEKLRSVGAFLAALVWSVHPIHSAAVDYISGRADSLAFVFSAGTWLLYLQGRDTKKAITRVLCYGLALIAALVALCARESALMWMLVFLFYLLIFERGPSWRTKAFTITICLGLVATYAGLRQLSETQPYSSAAPDLNIETRLVLMLRALGDYGRLMLWPANLHVERTILGATAEESHLAFGGVTLLGILTLIARYRGIGQRLRLLGVGWFLLGFLPISNLFALNATVAEHWLYLASVGFLLVLTGMILDLPARHRKIYAALAILAIAALGARSIARSADWVDSETFFRRTFSAGGTNPRIGINLAVVYARRGENARAEEVLRKVLQVAPNDQTARNNLALALAAQDKMLEAETLFRLAKDVRAEKTSSPPTWDAALHLAQTRYLDGDLPAAFAILGEARRHFPEAWALVKLEASLLREMQRRGEAIALVADFVRDHWWHSTASLALGELYAEDGNEEAAKTALQSASRLDVRETSALDLFALIQFNANQLEDALAAQCRAVSRQPDEPRQYRMLSDILLRMGRGAEAQLAMAKLASLEAVARADFATN